MNCEVVTEKLTSGVQSLCASDAAFFAVLEDGCVQAWGSPVHGGSTRINAGAGLPRVVQLCTIGCGFAALKEDGSVETWIGLRWVNIVFNIS